MTAQLITQLREAARRGATMVELLDLVHEAEGAPPYSRGLTMNWFHQAFALKPLDFSGIVFACVIFGDGATMSVSECERLFRERMVKLGAVGSPAPATSP